MSLDQYKKQIATQSTAPQALHYEVQTDIESKQYLEGQVKKLGLFPEIKDDIIKDLKEITNTTNFKKKVTQKQQREEEDQMGVEFFSENRHLYVSAAIWVIDGDKEFPNVRTLSLNFKTDEIKDAYTSSLQETLQKVDSFLKDLSSVAGKKQTIKISQTTFDQIKSKMQSEVKSKGLYHKINTGKKCKVISNCSGLGMDIPASSKQDGTNVIQWGEHGGANQQYTFETATGNKYCLKNVNSGHYLGGEGAKQENGTRLVQNAKNNAANQEFELEWITDQIFKMKLGHCNKVIDTDKQSKAQGAALVLNDSNDNPTQQFTLKYV